MYLYDFLYDSAFHYHCLKSCLYQVMDYYRLPEAYLFVDMTREFMLGSDSKSVAPICGVAQTGMAPAWDGVLSTGRFERKADAVYDLSRRLNRQTPVVIAVDTFYLPYHRSFGRNHGSHAVIIFGETADTYHLADWYEPHFYRSTVDKAIVNKARASGNEKENNPFSGQAICWQYWALEPSAVEDLSRFSANEVFQRGVADLYYSFYKRRISFNDTNRLYGLEAMERFIDLFPMGLEDVAGRGGWLQMYHENLFLLFISHRLFAYYVKTYLKNHGFPTASCMPLMNQLLAAYENVLFMLMKNTVSYQEKSMRTIYDLLKRIVEMEKTFGKALPELLDDSARKVPGGITV